MPIWLYETRPLFAAIVIMITIETISLIGLFLARRFLIRHFHASEGINDAISGTVQAIGVFYGITVGLIAVAVWNTYSNAGDLVSREASAIGSMYRDVGGYPSPRREEMRSNLREYTVFLIDKAWPAQTRGHIPEGGGEILDALQANLFSFEPATQGQAAIHAETIGAYNNLLEFRRLRVDAVESGLSDVMWAVIWAGAAISIGVAYFFRIDDAKLHALLVALMAGFLAIVIFMIVINDKPFYGSVSVSSDPYKLVLDRVIDRVK
ncbi:MAG TPA: DUF4239 domain-containing protein [Pyrinomonadaceae bacterium]|nr:DUF4239 domain-containing protein [Pyrinomonadaceae bacterium]